MHPHMLYRLDRLPLARVRPRPLPADFCLGALESSGGNTSGSSPNPSARAFVPLKKSTTAISSTMAASSKPSRFTAAVWEAIQY